MHYIAKINYFNTLHYIASCYSMCSNKQKGDCMTKIENGVHDIPNNVYHSSEGLSRSALWEFKKSPMHYWHKYLNPERVTKEPTPAMKLGEYVHALVLEPKLFEERYTTPPELLPVPKVELLKDLVSTLGKEEGRKEYDMQKEEREHIIEHNEKIMSQFAEIAKSKEIVKPEVYLHAKSIADAVMKDSIAQSLFIDTKVEQSIYFTHEPTGLQCKVRPDSWAGSIVTDLKTTIDAGYTAFQNDAYRSGYFLQAAMIKAALNSIGIELEKFIFFCVEKIEPYPCVYYIVDDEAMERGENEFNSLMYNIAHCFETNNWQSYEPQVLTYPKWARD
jgi:hypothetical protein